MCRWKVTLDTNVLIDLEKGSVHARKIVEAWRRGKIDLAVVGVTASERLPDGGYARSFNVFERRLERLGLGGIQILEPMGYWGITTFLGRFRFVGEEMVDLERQIHEILFPNIPFRLPPDADERTRRKWRNAKCDVQLMWAHIWYKRDVFVTSDGNFHKPTKRARLIELGAKRIETPESMAQMLADP